MDSHYFVAIIGSGPAGLSAAARAAELEMSYVILEKTDHIADTIFKYQTNKLVMATPENLPQRARVDFGRGAREDVLTTWEKNVREKKLHIIYNFDVEYVEGMKGNFIVRSKDHRIITAKNIILAIGTQGNPNRLNIPGADLPHVQYGLQDPRAHIDEKIIIVGAGDAGIENALGLVEDPEQKNAVTVLNRSASFSQSKRENTDNLLRMEKLGRLRLLRDTTPSLIEPGWLTVETRDGRERLPCDRLIVRIGSKPPRGFVERIGAHPPPEGALAAPVRGSGVQFAGDSSDAFPVLKPTYESSVPGVYVIGALAGYPLIKHCLNQGYDVVEYLNGNETLRPADEPLLERKLAQLSGGRDTSYWIDFFQKNVEILNGLTFVQTRSLLLESTAHHYAAGDIVFKQNERGSSLFAIAAGTVGVERPGGPEAGIKIGAGSIFGEVGLISGRVRGGTVRALEESVVLEIPRISAIRLMALSAAAESVIVRISTERQLLQIFGSGLMEADIAKAVSGARIQSIPAGETIIREGEVDNDVYVVRSGSMAAERTVAGRTVFLSYLPAGSYVGEIALVRGGPRTATVRAAIKSEVVKIPGATLLELLGKSPALSKAFSDKIQRQLTADKHVASKLATFPSAVHMHASVADFLFKAGFGEATDMLIIKDDLCIGCDNCEKACADTHGGLRRLDREAGRTFAHLHIPTSCRHCEHPHCMTDCPPDAIHRGLDGEVSISEERCIGCGKCQQNCPYGVIRMAQRPPKKAGSLLSWMFFGRGAAPGETESPPDHDHDHGAETHKVSEKKAVKCDMCAGRRGGPACVSACPTGAAIRVSPEQFLSNADR